MSTVVVSQAIPRVRQSPFIARGSAKLQFLSTMVIVIGALIIAFTLPQVTSEREIYRYGAYGMGGVLVVALFLESLAGVRTLLRADLVVLFGIYFLTFAEFLVPDVRILYDQPTGMADFSSQLVLLGIATLAIGRHFPIVLPKLIARPSLLDISIQNIFRTLLFLFFFGYIYVLISVNFDIFRIFNEAMQPRFMRPWQRGQTGGAISFLTELNLLLYPAAGIIGYLLSRLRDIGTARFVALIFLGAFMFFMDFTEGARNVLLIKGMILFLAYFIANRRLRGARLLLGGAAALAFLSVASSAMLEARSDGIGAYINSAGERVVETDATFMLDNNLVTIARVSAVFPRNYPFPGIDIVVQTLTKWVPRALWSGKPVNWENSIESALSTGGGFTLAVTYVGEAYLIAGIPTLIFVSFLLGSLSAAWNRVGLRVQSNLDLVYYCSGFFVFMLAVRSIQFITIAIVPLIAFLIISKMTGRRKARTMKRN